MNVVVYARYSSDSQREESIEGQLRECREYADRNGMTVVGSYIDRALSAKTADRPEFQRMIKDSAKGLFEIVLVWKLDRFSRDRYDSAHYKHILKKNGVKVVSAKEHISEGPEGIILESMLEGYAEFYSAELSEKIHRGQKENALKGKNNGGVPAIVPEELFCRVQQHMEKNKRAPAHTKAKESEFLLTTKLFCGKCERMMVGESGKSHTGTMPYYYKRGNTKRKDGCDEGQLERIGTNAPWSG